MTDVITSQSAMASCVGGTANTVPPTQQEDRDSSQWQIACAIDRGILAQR